MIYALLRKLLFLLDAEDAHELTTAQMERLQEVDVVRRAVARLYAYDDRAIARTLWGLRFRSPFGIAAGFDKNARLVPLLGALGFGFLEVGTVTLQPQRGNPRPRLFRFPEARAVVNRLGFNNDGALAVAARLARLHETERQLLPIIVNVGKNRDVPIDAAPEAYVACYTIVAPYADACVLNLSSPNTPSLRDLQRPEHLEKLLQLMRAVRGGVAFARPGEQPLLVKIAPDLDAAQLAEICAVCRELADGIVATNTTLARDAVPRAAHVSGGLSGAPLFARSTEILAAVRARVGPRFPLIGVGGVFTADDVRQKLAAGADLVQSYSGFIYEGPSMPSHIARELAARGTGLQHAQG